MCCKRRPGIRHADNLPRLADAAGNRQLRVADCIESQEIDLNDES